MPLPYNHTTLPRQTAILVDCPDLGPPILLDLPRKIFVAHTPAEIPPLLRAVEAAAQQGAWAAGWLAYEAATAFGLPVALPHPAMPLAWFALFDRVRPFIYPSPMVLPERLPPRPLRTREWHRQAVQTIHEALLAGESYQVNLTLPATLDWPHPPLDLFLSLQSRLRFPYAFYCHGAEADQTTTIASFSPELFLQRRGKRLCTAPIKGTRPRGATPKEDAELAQSLRDSAKEQAEHVMIVDMARNDLGRICRTGTVRVPHLMRRRSFANVHHLESRIEGEVPDGLDLAEIMAALFPAASITGAPKHRTMEIIRTVEEMPRGVYCGSLGIIRPGGDFIFNVAIRTLTATPDQERLQIGLGGGIVADSTPEREWQELADKGHFLTSTVEPLGLIETFRLEPGGTLPDFPRHLARLRHSASALGMECAIESITLVVQQQADLWQRTEKLPLLLRLFLSAGGDCSLGHRPLPPKQESLRVKISPWRVDGRDLLLRHKSNRRQMFDQALAEARREGYDEVLFLNSDGKVTEGAIRSLLVKLNGAWCVPPVEDGLLPGIWREKEMEKRGAVECSLTLDDLRQAEEIWLGNSGRGGSRVVCLDE